MKIHTVSAVTLISLSLASCFADDNWPQFRGDAGRGLSSDHPPTEWDLESGRNVAWHTDVPGLGHSAPIVWNNRVFLTTAINADVATPSVSTGWSGGAGESAVDSGNWTWQLICLSLDTGNLLWTRNACAGEPTIRRHLKASHANCTPATDGQHVVAFFGSEGLHCFDFAGRRIWQHDFGRLHSGPYDAPDLEWGFASSPILHDGKVIVQCDCLNQNFVAILDIETGAELSRIDRSGEVATWSTPLVVTSRNRSQIVCNGYHQMAGYDLVTGERLWHLHGGGDVPVPTPLFAEGLIFLTNGHGRAPTYAIKPDATGDITPTDDNPTNDGLAWHQPTDGSYMPTPLVKDGLLYTCNDNGRLTVRNARTGELIYQQRIGSGTRTFSASAVASADHLYFVTESGEVTVVRAGPAFERVAGNQMHDIVMATPAISGDRLLIRTLRTLYCLQ